MLDYFAIFTKGGALLWTLQFTTALKHNPVEALNALIRTCLLEERSADGTFTFTPKVGSSQSLKWTFENVSIAGRSRRGWATGHATGRRRSGSALAAERAAHACTRIAA